jgi:hypothetical protein
MDEFCENLGKFIEFWSLTEACDMSAHEAGGLRSKYLPNTVGIYKIAAILRFVKDFSQKMEDKRPNAGSIQAQFHKSPRRYTPFAPFALKLSAFA